MDNMIEAARRPLVELAPELGGALVLLDAGAAEVAQLSFGPAFLFGLGAGNVCELERTSPDDALLCRLSQAAAAGPSQNTPNPNGSSGWQGQPPPQPPLHLVVFLTRLLPDCHPLVLRALMVHSDAVKVTLCVSLSELAHAQQSGTDLGVEAYREYADALRQDLAQARASAGLPLPREESLVISVRHLPLHLAALDSGAFVLPAAGAAASMATSSGRAAGFGPPDAESDESDTGALGVSGGLALLAHALVDAAGQLGARLEPFSLGPVSAKVAREIATLPQPAAAPRFGGPDGSTSSPRHPGAALTGGSGGAFGGGFGGGGGAMPVALLLIDRSLDLVTPCSHSDHFLDGAVTVLQRRPPAPPPAHAVPGRWAFHRPADVRFEVPGFAPWDCLGPESTGVAIPGPASTPPAGATTAEGSGGGGGGGLNSGSGGGGDVRPGSSGSGGVGIDGNPSEPSSSAGVTDPTSTTAAAAAAAAEGSATGGDADQQQKDQQPLPPLPDAPPLGAPLFEPSDRRSLQLLESLVIKKGRDGLSAVRKALKDALRAERAPPVRAKLTANVTAAELETLTTALAQAPGDAALRQLPALFLASAAAQVLGSPRWDAWAALAALERQITAIVADAAETGGGAGASLQALFTDLLASQATGKGLLNPADALQLLVSLYSLSGDLTPPAPPMYSADEIAIRGALAEALTAAAEAGRVGDPAIWEALPLPLQGVLSEGLEAAGGREGLRSTLDARLAECFVRLRWAAATRGKLRDARRLIGLSPEGAPAADPLIRQIISRVLSRGDIRDLQSHGGPSLGGILKAGLGRLGFGAAIGAIGAAGGGGGGGGGARAPHEYPAVLVFVVGGVCAAEWRAVRAEVEQHRAAFGGGGPAVLLGGTTLLAPGDAVRHLLS